MGGMWSLVSLGGFWILERNCETALFLFLLALLSSMIHTFKHLLAVAWGVRFPAPARLGAAAAASFLLCPLPGAVPRLLLRHSIPPRLQPNSKHTHKQDQQIYFHCQLFLLLLLNLASPAQKLLGSRNFNFRECTPQTHYLSWEAQLHFCTKKCSQARQIPTK